MARARGGAGSFAKSARTQLALGGLFAVGLGIAYWQFLYAPLTEKRQRLRSEYTKFEKENRTLGQEERVQNDMIQCKPELDALNRQNELMLPADSEPVAFLKNLTNMAASAGLQQGPTKKLAETQVAAPADPAAVAAAKKATADKAAQASKKKPAGAQPAADPARPAAGADPGSVVPCWEKVPGLAGADTANSTFVRVPFEIEVTGTFHQLTRYFWMIHQHANGGRIITIENLSLRNPRATPEGMFLTATFVAVGFREPDSAVAASDGEIAAPTGGRGQVREANERREAQADAAADVPRSGAQTPASGAAPAATNPAEPAGGGATPPPAGSSAPPPGGRAEQGLDRIQNPGAP